jgi:predicted transcriptional regulator
MVVKDICTREVITATKDSTVIHAAKLMEEYNTGSVVIIKKNEIKQIPIGLITDRDVAIKFVATEMNQQTKIEELMNEAITIEEDTGIEEALVKLRFKKARRALVVDENEFLTGIITIDDILINIYKELSSIATIIQNEQPG